MMQDEIRTNTAPKPVGAYPHARRVGNLLFLSGLGPRSEIDNSIPGTFAGQCHAVFANIKAVLLAAGSSWESLVDVTVFLTDIKTNFAEFNEIYKEYFTDNQPARTTVEINALPTPIAIELKCIATIKDE